MMLVIYPYTICAMIFLILYIEGVNFYAKKHGHTFRDEIDYMVKDSGPYHQFISRNYLGLVLLAIAVCWFPILVMIFTQIRRQKAR
jgi:hypothetical protein